MKQYQTYEMQFQGDSPVGSSVEINLQATFINESEKVTVKGFYKGNGTYVIRFLPRFSGMYRYDVSGIFHESGEIFCEPADREHHGFVKAENTHFIYEDGTKYIPFGTTVYALAHQSEELIQETMCTLQKSPFNKVRYCVFPKSYDYNHNEPELFPFQKKEDGSWDVHQPCYEFWNHLENIIFQLQDMGIETDLILFHSYDRWGFCFLSLEEWLVYLEYVMRRFSAIPSIWWSMANEYDLIFNHEYKEWFVIEDFIAQNDPYSHLLSNHNGMKMYDFTRENITHCSIQTNAIHLVDEWQKKYEKPVILDEVCYEGNLEQEWGSITGFEMVNRFWKAYVRGGYMSHGETYFSEDEILWWSKGGQLKGTSPARIAFLKELFYHLPGTVEPWEEPFFEDFCNPTEIKKEGEIPGFIKLMLSLSEEEKAHLSWKNARYTGHIEDKVFLRYFGESRPALCTIHLPQEHEYSIEVIDIWEMTRKQLMASASGKTLLKLPGKEGIAILCTRK